MMKSRRTGERLLHQIIGVVFIPHRHQIIRGFANVFPVGIVLRNLPNCVTVAQQIVRPIPDLFRAVNLYAERARRIQDIGALFTRSVRYNDLPQDKWLGDKFPDPAV